LKGGDEIVDGCPQREEYDNETDRAVFIHDTATILSASIAEKRFVSTRYRTFF
jgi:hypothetical protein